MKSVLIPVYHSVSDVATPPYRPFSITPERFAQHLAFLRREGYRGVTISQLVAQADSLTTAEKSAEKIIALTFDDGLADFYSGALPILQEYGFPATLYVVGGRVCQTSDWLANVGEGHRPMLDWEQLREIAAAGVEIGAHSLSHPELDTLPGARAAQEIRESHLLLEDRLGLAIRSFAYPYGYHGGQVRAQVIAAGYASACAVKNKRCVLSLDKFSLARMTVLHNHTAETLAGWLQPDGLPSDNGRITPQTRMWRVYRKVRSLR
jgi:peptidoglycan/xylan/chitin deacetylase (PgdA/CDA1 family)